MHQPRKGFFKVQQPHIVQSLREEAGVQQVHSGVFRAAGILVNRHPVTDLCPGRKPPRRRAGRG